jgi:hypothetical protein
MSCDLKTATLDELRQQCKPYDPEHFTEYLDDRERVFAAALDLTDLDPEEAAFLTVAQRVYREDHGCDTPIEQFIRRLIDGLRLDPITLDYVLEEVKELKDDWYDALHMARRFYVQHRDLVTQQPKSKAKQESNAGNTDNAASDDSEHDPLAGAAVAVNIALASTKQLLPLFTSPTLESALKHLQAVKDEIANKREESGADDQAEEESNADQTDD